MCRGCWEEYERPEIDTPAVREASRAIAEVYEFAETGGDLHIVLDDWNLEDHSLAFCREAIEEDSDFTFREREVERRCLSLLRALTEDERASALALYEGFWGSAVNR